MASNSVNPRPDHHIVEQTKQNTKKKRDLNNKTQSVRADFNRNWRNVETLRRHSVGKWEISSFNAH